MLAPAVMKATFAFSAAIGLSLVACDTMNRPLTSGDFDPLRAPGNMAANKTNPGVVFTAGQFVRATMDNTAFFKSRPKGEMDADKLLTRGTSMKVISHNDSYVKVELDSGEIGFVPTVMLEDPNAAPAVSVPRPGEFQVYPPLGSSQAPPPVLPAEKPPEGAIPTVIDPEAPALVPPSVAPSMPKPEHTPLPPNGEEGQ